MLCTKESVRLGVPGYADAIECPAAPPLEQLFAKFAELGGELFLCPISFKVRRLDEATLVANAPIAGATPMWEWIGDDPPTVFTY